MCDLKTFRKTNNLTQSDIADFLGGGVGKAFISQIEHGNRKLPSAQLAKLLNNPYGWDTSALAASVIRNGYLHDKQTPWAHKCQDHGDICTHRGREEASCC